MKPTEFITHLQNQVVEEYLKIYKEIFNNNESKDMGDDYWRMALKFYNSLDVGLKEDFFMILRQVQIDTVSNVLGIIDGVSFLENQEDEFVLSTSEIKEKINGELQDIFLELTS